MVEHANPMVLPFFGALKPWQQTFIYVGLPGMFLAAFFLLLKEPARRPSMAPDTGTSDTSQLIAFYKDNARTISLPSSWFRFPSAYRVCVRILEHYLLCART